VVRGNGIGDTKDGYTPHFESRLKRSISLYGYVDVAPEEACGED